MKSTGQQFQLSIPSSRKNITLVEKFFHTVNDSFKLPEERLHALLVSVTEAVNNGIIHGNKNDESKHVVVTCSKKGKTLTVKVHDEGKGFKPEDIANPLHEDNLLRTGGRGVFLMKAFMQSVTYNEQGNEVTLVMKL
ncbi:MAG TPA: ATP-binding protein [Bacteroidetes bacterium]|nr:ATP-binding protein [Bacteroidota bacterium]